VRSKIKRLSRSVFQVAYFFLLFSLLCIITIIVNVVHKAYQSITHALACIRELTSIVSVVSIPFSCYWFINAARHKDTQAQTTVKILDTRKNIVEL
jgi:hypothetical protein